MRNIIKLKGEIYMQEKKTFKESMKELWDNHKGKIIIGGTILGAVAAVIAVTRKDEPEEEEEVKQIEEPKEDKTLEYGRDCLMTFSVEDTGEVLWKERCTESYVEDVKEMGMQFEEVRKLNGIDK